MAYVVNGKVVEKKAFNLMDFIYSILNFIRLFFLTIFTTESMQKHVDEYNSTKGFRATGGSSLGRGPQVKTFGPAAAAGCTGGG